MLIQSTIGIVFMIATFTNAKVIDSFGLESILGGLSGVNETSPCGIEIQRYLNGLLFKEKWAARMYDSSANKLYSLFEGNNRFVNGYDECLRMAEVEKSVSTQYCVLNMEMVIQDFADIDIFALEQAVPEQLKPIASNLLSLFYGVCLPANCSVTEIDEALRNWSAHTAEDDDVEENEEEINYKGLVESNCFPNKHSPFSKLDYVTVGILASIIFLALASTTYDVYQRFSKNNDKPNIILASFSIYNNLKIWLETSDDKIKSVDCIRTLAAFWIVLAHSAMFTWLRPTQNALHFFGVIKNIHLIFLWNAYEQVDTFFFISGFLVALGFFQTVKKKGYFDVPRSYISRYLRLTPTFALLILIQASIFYQLGEGPLWNSYNDKTIFHCDQHWWSRLLYVQNIYGPHARCMNHGWYLSADMQLFWISPLLLVPVLYWPSLAPFLFATFILVATAISFGVNYLNEFGPLILDMLENRLEKEYTQPYCRAPAWLIGLAFGYVFYRLQGKKIKLSKAWVTLGWMTSITLMLATIYGILPFTYDKQTVFENALYITFHRIAWALGLAWLVFACEKGYGGPVASFLSWKVFQPLAKLSYGIYLVHVLVLDYEVGISRNSVWFNFNELMYFYVPALVITVMISLLLFILVEVPFNIISICLLRNLKILSWPKVSTLEFKINGKSAVN